MASLSAREQRFLVELHAEYTPVATILEMFEREFGRSVDRKQAHEYNCERSANRRDRAESLVSHFDRCREDYFAVLAQRRIARQEWRLGELEEIYLEERKAGLRKSAKATLEQAAKESGGAYTNKRDLTSGGLPIKGYGAGVDFDDL